MKIVTSYYCIIFNIVVIFPNLSAKPVSLNDLIKREYKVTAIDQKNHLLLDTIVQGKKISPAKYRRTFHIKSPLKPRKIKHSQKTRNKRKNQTTKTDYYHDGQINQNYVPLLKNLGLLFNHILNPESSDDDNSPKYDSSYNTERDDVCECAFKSNSDTKTSDSQKKAVTVPRIISPHKTLTSTIATTPTYNFTDDHNSHFRRHKNVSLLLPRNTISLRRNNNRFRKGSGSTYNGSVEGHVTRNHRNNERPTRVRAFRTYTEDNVENTYGNTRDGTSSNRSDDTIRKRKGLRNSSRETKIIITPTLETNKTLGGFKRNIFKHKGESEYKITRNETKNARLLRKPSPRIRGFKPLQKAESFENITYNEETLHKAKFNIANLRRITDRNGQIPKENQKIRRTNEALTMTTTTHTPRENLEILTTITNNEPDNLRVILNTSSVEPYSNLFSGTTIANPDDSNLTDALIITTTTLTPVEKLKTNIFEVTFNTTSIMRFPDRHNHRTSPENQQTHNSDIGLTTTKTISTPVEKFVMIYDGYSVARDVNGKNALEEKSITIRK